MKRHKSFSGLTRSNWKFCSITLVPGVSVSEAERNRGRVDQAGDVGEAHSVSTGVERDLALMAHGGIAGHAVTAAPAAHNVRYHRARSGGTVDGNGVVAAVIGKGGQRRSEGKQCERRAQMDWIHEYSFPVV